MPSQQSADVGLLSGRSTVAWTLSSVGILYALGLLIENWALSRFHIVNHEIIRPRAIFVGVAFVVFVLAQIAVVALPLEVLKHSYDWSWQRMATAYRLPFAVVLSLLALLFTSFAIGAMLHYFIPAAHVPPLYVAAVLTWVAIADGFLLMIQGPLVLAVGALSFAYWRRQPVSLWEHRQVLWGVAIFFALASLHGFVNITSLHVHSSVGGMMPRMVELYSGPYFLSIDPAAQRQRLLQELDSESFGRVSSSGRMLLWHETPEYLYVMGEPSTDHESETPLQVGPDGASLVGTYETDANVVAIRKSELTAVRYLNSFPIFRGGRFVEVREHSQRHNDSLAGEPVIPKDAR